MIQYTTGDLLQAETEALVNPVNCVGVMGKGIALQFKQTFPDNFKEYQKEAHNDGIKPGKMFTFHLDSFLNPKYIINFPTKRHWKGRSLFSDIQIGLKSLVHEIKYWNIQSIAIPALGCGNGNLEWEKVRPLMEEALAPLPNVHIVIYCPNDAPATITPATNKPKLTRARALLIVLMDEYLKLGYCLTFLEIQKLAYFLQEVGESLRLDFQKHDYGPYADALHHVLIRLEGHYISGYMDGSRNKDVEIHVLPGASRLASGFLATDAEALQHLEMVKQIIRGYETPYGMELLASAHWLMKYEQNIQTSKDLVAGFCSWNARKRDIFEEKHINKAWEHVTSLHRSLPIGM